MLSLVAKGPLHTGECRGPCLGAPWQWLSRVQAPFLPTGMWDGLPEGVEETTIGAELGPARSSSAAVSEC